MYACDIDQLLKSTTICMNHNTRVYAIHRQFTDHWDKLQKHLWTIAGFQSALRWETQARMLSSVNQSTVHAVTSAIGLLDILYKDCSLTLPLWMPGYEATHSPCYLEPTCRILVDSEYQYSSAHPVQPWARWWNQYEEQTQRCSWFRSSWVEDRWLPRCSGGGSLTAVHEHTAQTLYGTLRSNCMETRNQLQYEDSG